MKTSISKIRNYRMISIIALPFTIILWGVGWILSYVGSSERLTRNRTIKFQKTRNGQNFERKTVEPQTYA
jgi:hypothetical protein